MAARRKAKSTRKPETALGVDNVTLRDSPLADLDDDEEAPSSSMTREIEAATTAQLLASMRSLGSSPPHVEDTVVVDDLARTIEAPSASRVLILDAAENLVAHIGFARLDEREVAKAAHVAEDVLRAHFSDKRSLLRALNERFCAHAVDAADEATRSGIWDNAAPRDVLEIATRSIIDVVASRSALVHAVLTSGDEAMLDELRRVGAKLTSRVTRVIDEMAVGAGQKKPDAHDIAFVLLLAVSLAHNVVLVGTEWTGIELDGDDVYQRAHRAIRAYLDAQD